MQFFKTPTLTEIKENRRAFVAFLLDRHGKVRLGELVDINPDYLFQMGKAKGKSARSVSDATAEKIEKALGLKAGVMNYPLRTRHDGTPYLPVVFGPPDADAPAHSGPERPDLALTAVPSSETPAGYVRFQLLEGAGGMGAGAVNQDYPEVVRHVEMAEWEVRRKIGFLPSPGRIALLTGRGPSMRPLVDHGDVVMVDTAIDSFQGDAVYVININGETQIKMLQMRPGGLHIVSANTDYPAYPVAEEDDVVIGGKVVSVLGVRQV